MYISSKNTKANDFAERLSEKYNKENIEIEKKERKNMKGEQYKKQFRRPRRNNM